MPRASPTDGSDPRECPECHRILARKGDLPRHLRTHLDPVTKDSLSYKCPYDGCTFSNLQKSNVNTHLRTHTNEKSIVCPDVDICGFATSDPAALTRHRKRRHDYVPRPRKRRAVASQPAPISPTESSVTSSDVVPNTIGSLAPATAPVGVDLSLPTVTIPGLFAFPVFTPATIPHNCDIYGMLRPSVSCEKSSELSDLVNAPCSDGVFWGPLTRSLQPKILLPAYDSAPPLHTTSVRLSSKHDLNRWIVLAPTSYTSTAIWNSELPELYIAVGSVTILAYLWLFKRLCSTFQNFLGPVTPQAECSFDNLHGFLRDSCNVPTASDVFYDEDDAIVVQQYEEENEHDAVARLSGASVV
ncbi:hypothetical protein F5876DRAFT_77069 [Lentinula aff. lateritia]|uniref:Uncharacterized protein n=1 Tax=Lentinula aff. lateritia TaxID=2804960 RepID=A0ACC1TZE8_9AGAR|nr:hypothetical protein F5876DRAFT_77069 [Lentinula aff. lateritia]